jgi:hypothetical protein
MLSDKSIGRVAAGCCNGTEYTKVEEYCISEGWIRTTIGKTLGRRGKPLTLIRKGVVEPFYKD